MRLSSALRVRKQALPPHFLRCNAAMDFALFDPSYKFAATGWVEQSETHPCAQRSPG
jgi:hypothetical protein